MFPTCRYEGLSGVQTICKLSLLSTHFRWNLVKSRVKMCVAWEGGGSEEEGKSLKSFVTSVSLGSCSITSTACTPHKDEDSTSKAS